MCASGDQCARDQDDGELNNGKLQQLVRHYEKLRIVARDASGSVAQLHAALDDALTQVEVLDSELRRYHAIAASDRATLINSALASLCQMRKALATTRTSAIRAFGPLAPVSPQATPLFAAAGSNIGNIGDVISVGKKPLVGAVGPHARPRTAPINAFQLDTLPACNSNWHKRESSPALQCTAHATARTTGA